VSAARKLLLSGVAVTALLAVVAIASRAHTPGGGSGGGSVHAPELVIRYMVAMAIVLVPIGAVMIVWAAATGRKMKLLERQANWRRTAITIGFAIVVLLVVAFVLRNQKPNTNPFGRNNPSGGAADSQPGSTAPEQWLVWYVLASILVGLLVTVVLALIFRRRHAEEIDREAELARALDIVLADTLDDLRGELDPRRAVISAYARMEQTFAAYGAPRGEAQTPQEYVATALDRLQVSEHAVTRLTGLYERAKFSTHEIGGSMKDEAIDVLAALRGELEAGNQVAA
jgi:NADH:ubiquinone oxidoreductase subunit 6 (subunit J)